MKDYSEDLNVPPHKMRMLMNGKNIKLSKEDLATPSDGNSITVFFKKKSMQTRAKNAKKKGAGMVLKPDDIHLEKTGGSFMPLGQEGGSIRRLRRGFQRMGRTLGRVTDTVVDGARSVAPEIAGIATKEAIKGSVGAAVTAATGQPMLGKIAASSAGNVIGDKVGKIVENQVEKQVGNGLASRARKTANNVARSATKVANHMYSKLDDLHDMVTGSGLVQNQRILKKTQRINKDIEHTGGVVHDRFDQIVDPKTKMAYVRSFRGGSFRSL